jgi:hypothetical protein
MGILLITLDRYSHFHLPLQVEITTTLTGHGYNIDIHW